MFGYRLKWNFLKRNFLCLAFNRLSPTTNFFCHRSFYRFNCRTERLTNLLTIDRLINTANFLATGLSFLKKAFFICITIGIRYILGCIWKDYRFCLRHCPFRYLVDWVLWLNRGFTNMAFLLRSLGFDDTGIGWVLRLNWSFTHMTFFLRALGFDDTGISWVLRLNWSFSNMAFFLCPFSFHYSCKGWVLRLNSCFTHVTFFLRPLSCYNWSRAWLRDWLWIFFCPDGKNL